MTVPTNSAQSWRAAFTGSYDDEKVEFLAKHVAQESFVLDIGASLGFYSIPLGVAARRAQAHVVAIEPIRRNCEVLRGNVRLNDLEGVVHVIECALGRTEGEVTLHVETGGAGNATVVDDLDPGEVERHDRAGGTGRVERVALCTLDGLELPAPCQGRRCSVIKLDAEGFELDILSGGKRFVDSSGPLILGEFSPEWLATRGVSPTAPQEWADSNGYTCYELTFSRTQPWADTQKVSLKALPRRAARSGTDLVLVPERR